jgi:hypothetical protein
VDPPGYDGPPTTLAFRQDAVSRNASELTVAAR